MKIFPKLKIFPVNPKRKVNPIKTIDPVKCRDCKYSILDTNGTRLCRNLKFNEGSKKYVLADFARFSKTMCGPEGKYFTQEWYYPDHLTFDEYF